MSSSKYLIEKRIQNLQGTLSNLEFSLNRGEGAAVTTDLKRMRDLLTDLEGILEAMD